MPGSTIMKNLHSAIKTEGMSALCALGLLNISTSKLLVPHPNLRFTCVLRTVKFKKLIQPERKYRTIDHLPALKAVVSNVISAADFAAYTMQRIASLRTDT
eukprot:scaffold58502_cov18-Tisochrysis_lutea.AAC.2